MTEFSKEAGKRAKEALNEVMEDQSDQQAAEFFGHFNEISLFIDAAIAEAPEGDSGE